METKERIMEEFIKQFIQKDCKDILVDEIAFNIGISKRTIYENFSSKNEIIRQSLRYYLLSEQERLTNIVKEEKNSLKKILRLYTSFISNISKISVVILYNLKKRYPTIAEELIDLERQFLNTVVMKLFIQAGEEGYIFKQIRPEILFALFILGDRDPRKTTVDFMGMKISTLELFIIHFFVIIRGISTSKGIKTCDKYYAEFCRESVPESVLQRNIINN